MVVGILAIMIIIILHSSNIGSTSERSISRGGNCSNSRKIKCNINILFLNNKYC